MHKLIMVFPLMILVIAGCSATGKDEVRPIRNASKWAIFPTSTVLGKKKQFVVTGENLYATDFAVSGSVTLEKGDVSTDGSTIKLFITIDTLDAAEPFDTAGSRVIKVRTPDGLKELTLKVVGEQAKEPEKSAQ